jgi:2,3-bisphosphoglycerate-independent phosphoglycerate mutase
MTSPISPKFVVLAILDGWGIAPEGPGNAISLANTVNVDKFWRSYPHTQLEASGEAVGLPRGEDGNTETGHLNLGAGRIVYQDLERINMSIADGSFFENRVLLEAIAHTKKLHSALHYIGLLGAGGVHSNIDHLIALIQLASRHNVEKLYIHPFTDGRDSPPTAAKTYISRVTSIIEKEKIGQIASIMGRYWAMDRDQRWNRTEMAYNALVKGSGKLVKAAEEAIDASYSEGKTDEFIEPSLISLNGTKPIATIKDNDAIVFFNFRVDRPRQLSRAFIFSNRTFASVSLGFDPYQDQYQKTHLEKQKKRDQAPFIRGPKLQNLFFVTMTEYEKPLTQQGARPAFPPEVLKNSLGEVLSINKINQLRITESEKERFITYYFNGLREKPFPQEDRIIIPSPSVTTYDQKPEMSSKKITDTLLDMLSASKYKFVLVNYPNADMVGHTGNIGPTVKAIEAVDECIGKLANFILSHEGALIVTSDHGNAEEMVNLQTGEIDTEHSNISVPFIAIAQKLLGIRQNVQTGILADIAPTVLSLLNLPIHPSMTGRNLLAEVKNNEN